MDNGNSWHISDAPTGFNLYHLPLLENTIGHFFAAGQNNIILSIDQGLTWQTLPWQNHHDILTYTISPNQHIYLGLLDGLWRTTNPTTQGAYLHGHVRKDADAECSTDDAQQPLAKWNIQAAGDFTFYTTTNSEGAYQFFIDTGTYSIKANVPQALWWSLCDTVQTISIDTLYTTDTLDFTALALAECPLMSVSVGAHVLRRCFDNTVYVHYCNQGSETADSAWVDVALDPQLAFVSSAQPHDDVGGDTFRFYLGNVMSGECGQFSLVVHVECEGTVLGQTHCITAHAYPDTLCMAVPNWSGATIEAEAECQDTSIRFRLRNTGSTPSQLLDYIIIEDDVVLMQGQGSYAPGEEKIIDRPANGRTWRVESQQEPGHPFSVQAVAFAEGCGGFESLGFVNQFNVNTFQHSWHRLCLENSGAFDPNDKQGFPLGFGAEHRIRPGQELDYMIRFQNTGTDTAFNVVIRDTLSAWLDPTSVRPGAASHPYTWELSGQGVARFTFSNILLPDSATNLAASQGFVMFKIGQQPDVPLQAQIFNSAAIYFDFNPPVITNQTLHTVGTEYLVGTSSPTNVRKATRVAVFPNPVAEWAAFQLKEGIFNQHRLVVTDAFGRNVTEAVVSGRQYLFQRKALPPGIYFFRVEEASGRLVEAGNFILR